VIHKVTFSLRSADRFIMPLIPKGFGVTAGAVFGVVFGVVFSRNPVTDWTGLWVD
jgi:hypothetical protein